MSVYKDFFNLKVKPFDLVPNPDFLYMSSSHKKAVTFLRYGLREKTGFMLLTGEAGTGKTTLLRNLLKNIRGKVTVSKLFNSKVNSEQMLAMINDDFGLDVLNKDKVALLKDLNDFLIAQYANGYHPLLVVDEAQNLSADLLEEIRLISNLETDNVKLIQIILCGQTELRKALDRPELRQLRQRISISCHITPLGRDETSDYIYHRLDVAGNRRAVEFNEGVIDVIHAFSKGIPRLINVICDFLLLLAFMEEKKTLTVDAVREVISEMDLENRHVEARGDGPPQAGYARPTPDLNGKWDHDEIHVKLDNITKLINGIGVRLDNYIRVSMRHVGQVSENKVLQGNNGR